MVERNNSKIYILKIDFQIKYNIKISIIIFINITLYIGVEYPHQNVLLYGICFTQFS